MAERTSIGGILLESVEGWSFSARDGVIAGKRGKTPGVLRILSVLPNELPQPLTHEACLRLAAERSGAANAEPFDRQLTETATGPFGSASFRVGKDQICIWYCSRPAGLIIGALACPTSHCSTPQYRFLRVQCARMISSSLFDRSAWGAADTVTQILKTHLEPEESEDAPAPPGKPDTPPPQPARPPRKPR